MIYDTGRLWPDYASKHYETKARLRNVDATLRMRSESNAGEVIGLLLPVPIDLDCR